MSLAANGFSGEVRYQWKRHQIQHALSLGASLKPMALIILKHTPQPPTYRTIFVFSACERYAKLEIYITIWVDDLLIARKHRKAIASVKQLLTKESEMKDLRELTWDEDYKDEWQDEWQCYTTRIAFDLHPRF